MTPSQLLEESISDIQLRRTFDPKKLDAFFAAAAVAIPTVLRAAAAGNEQCKMATLQMAASLQILQSK